MIIKKLIKMIIRDSILVFLLFASTMQASLAAVSETQAARLGADLSPIGAKRAGNKDGSIPKWENETPKAIGNFSSGDHHPNPFPDDKPLFTINSTNASEYDTLLSEGHKILLKNNPKTFLQVYQTRRTATYPDKVYKNAKQNAVSATLVDSGEGVDGSIGAVPFPIPKDGYEVMWNHKLRYRGEAVKTYSASTVVNTNGAHSLMKVEATIKFKFASKKKKTNEAINLVGKTTSPPRMAGNKLLMHESINSFDEPRQTWIYMAGQRRTRRAPDISHDAPYPGTDGIVLVDNTDMFNGALDRFEWELIGKKELFIPYNSYDLHSAETEYDEILQPGSLNPMLSRYERHRVWVVEATLKSGFRHRFSKRVFYIDEDSWQVALVDQYDGRGNLFSFSEGHPINYYENPLFWYTLEAVYNLQDGRYYVSGLDNQERMYDFSVKPRDGLFKPASLARMR